MAEQDAGQLGVHLQTPQTAPATSAARCGSDAVKAGVAGGLRQKELSALKLRTLAKVGDIHGASAFAPLQQTEVRS